MRKYIIFALATLLAVAMISLGTFAWFSDTEEGSAEGQTGTINIEIDGDQEDGEAFSRTIGDLKPCDAKYIEIEITNIGENPAVIRKHITSVDVVNNYPEGLESRDDPSYPEDPFSGDPLSELPARIDYDLSVDGETIFEVGDMTLDDVVCMWMPVGTLQPDESMTVVQSYHLQAETGNWAQGYGITVNMEFFAEQRLGPGPDQAANKVFLDNKTGEDDWYFIADQVWGVLDWSAVSGEFYAQGLSAGTDYSLITYVDPYPGTVSVLASGTSTDGTLTFSGISMPSGYEGKIWLVLSSDVGSGKMSGWTPTAYLYEGNKVSIP